ncbi:hypothetical protein LCGC14_2862520 [marine sediment metagenome]|uniref:Uncharacterized protein n=1 Tax=marine sediment metagenome TaxID=412755 RepID=A0A0F9AWE8_9ZZZZ
MAGERDQTKWVGIRPTDPAVNIPVTESSPLTQIKVEPLVAGTEFKTLTKKRSPAVADLQAIEAIVSEYFTDDIAGGRFDISFSACPAGKIWVIQSITSYASAAWGNTNIYLRVGAEYHAVAGPILANWFGTWNGTILLQEDDWLLSENRGAVNGNTYHVSMRGYQIALY